MALKIKTEVRPSLIHGLGLFALNPIPKGTVVWAFDEVVDTLQPSPGGDFSWRTEEGYVIPGDDAKYINHSPEPNLETTPGLTPVVAARDIHAGEELTESYTYDLDWETYGPSLT